MPAHPTPSYTMNVRRIYAYEDTSAAGLGTFEFPKYEPEDSLRIGRAVALADVPGLDGSVALNGDDTPLGALAVTRRFTFLETTRQALQDDLTAMMKKLSGGTGRLWRYVPHATDATLQYQWTPAIVAELPAPQIAAENRLIAACVAKFSCPLGVWFLDDNAETLYGEAGIYGAGLLYGTQGQGWSIDDGAAPYTVSHTVTNRGDAWARALVFQITAGAGGMPAVTISNTTTGHSVSQAGSLSSGEMWQWDTYKPSVRKYSGSWADDWSNCTPGSSQRGLFALAPGNNTIVVAAAAAMDGDFALEYYEPFL